MATVCADPLQRYFPEILKYLDFTSIFPYLVSEKLLTLIELENLKKCNSHREEQIELLVSLLARKGRGCYSLFRKALERSVESDDMSIHLGHADLLEILPKSLPIKEASNNEEEIEAIGKSLKGLRIRQRLDSGDDLTDSGIQASYNDVEADFPSCGQSKKEEKEETSSVLTDSLSKAMQAWQKLERSMKEMKRRNQELQREKEELHLNMMRERNEVNYFMQVCLKQILQPDQYPYSRIVNGLLLQTSDKSTSSTIHSILILVVGNSLTDGESLNTISLILSSLFGLPVSPNALHLHRPSYLHLFNDSLLQVTILKDSEREMGELKRRPDLFIAMYTDERSLFYSSSMLTWARGHDLLAVGVQLALDHCTGVSAKCVSTTPNLPIEEGTPKLHVLPLHHHLACLSFHLSSLYVDCVERASSSLSYALVDCNRERLKKREAAVTGNAFSRLDASAIFELELFCL